MAEPLSEYLFSYGTLHIESVQFATFGRRLEGNPDALPGFTRSMVKIEDPEVVEASREAISSDRRLHRAKLRLCDRSSPSAGTSSKRPDAYAVAAYETHRGDAPFRTRPGAYAGVRHDTPPDS